jgi:hypothetical protein
MKRKTKRNKPTIEELKEFWDGPKVGFNEELYKKYLQAKRAWRAKMN